MSKITNKQLGHGLYWAILCGVFILLGSMSTIEDKLTVAEYSEALDNRQGRRE